MRKTKIICTLGPAVGSVETLKKLIQKGMNVARLNFSHGTHEQHQIMVDMLKEARDAMGVPVALLLDTKGPEIRIGKFEEGEVLLVEGQEFVLTNNEIMGDVTMASVSYKELYLDIKNGDRILFNDGLIELEVEKIVKGDIHCQVLNGGLVSNNKGVNVPDVKTGLPALSSKDYEDIKFAIRNDFEFIAASFIRDAASVIEIKKFLKINNGSSIHVISKIENRQGVDNIDEIIKVSDGIMIARGDLGVEIPVQEVPIVQKSLISKCYMNGKPVITATQMLDSMIRNPRPTRAEVSDVANAIFDFTSAIMLSGETAVGKYPLETVDTMVKITLETEKSIDYWHRFYKSQYDFLPNVTNAISHATCTTALDLKAGAIITVTSSGYTARMISRFRPSCPIIATTTIPKVQRQLALSWGVSPFLVKEASTSDEMFETGVEKALDSNIVNFGDLVVITAGIPIGISGTTNILKVHIAGKVLIKAEGIGTGKVTGKLCVESNPEKAIKDFADGDILVVPFTNNDMLPIIKRASALITEQQGLGNHAAIVGLSLDIPVIVGAENASKILKSGSVVTVDAKKGLVYCGDCYDVCMSRS